MKRRPTHSYFQLMEKRGIHIKKKIKEELGKTEVHHTGEIMMIPLVPTSLKEKNKKDDFIQVVENNSVGIDPKTGAALVYLNKTDLEPIKVDFW